MRLAFFLLSASAASGSQVVPGFKTTYDVIKPGSGKLVTKGATVAVHATGNVLSDAGAKKFWSTKDPGQQPFTYTAGMGGVITGWDQGVLGAQLGEVRVLVIPSDEGYGASGFPAWGIPERATLQFEIEVLSIKGGKDEI